MLRAVGPSPLLDVLFPIDDRASWRTPLPERGTCHYCLEHRDKLSVCSTCLGARYCGKDHQIAAWKTHKRNCQDVPRKEIEIIDAIIAEKALNGEICNEDERHKLRAAVGIILPLVWYEKNRAKKLLGFMPFVGTALNYGITILDIQNLFHSRRISWTKVHEILQSLGKAEEVEAKILELEKQSADVKKRFHNFANTMCKAMRDALLQTPFRTFSKIDKMERSHWQRVLDESEEDPKGQAIREWIHLVYSVSQIDSEGPREMFAKSIIIVPFEEFHAMTHFGSMFGGRKAVSLGDFVQYLWFECGMLCDHSKALSFAEREAVLLEDYENDCKQFVKFVIERNELQRMMFFDEKEYIAAMEVGSYIWLACVGDNFVADRNIPSDQVVAFLLKNKTEEDYALEILCIPKEEVPQKYTIVDGLMV